MTIKVLIHAYRKPGISPSVFKQLYEAHIDLLKYISGDDFPLSHKRSYIARSTIDSSAESLTTPRNASTPARVIVGLQSDFDFDAYAELTFEDKTAYDAFLAKVYAPEAAAKIAADEEKFLDRSTLAIVTLGDVFETTK
ncbi:uncharacterized protein N7477_008233 [Penicillium maclennaniae]|uniref:uncharacterized protein n=1 Tax=Penicillium maclennaniae TaxID=1343394 RepID=UPI00254040B9|nr:uncharacterized protein N7477_008233 [Penicillium maclennaniae]KAJ5665785.1 hypothetical protein N7477_008233 [Penicillium maclennaniae]